MFGPETTDRRLKQMQLMREMYQLGEFQAWEAMLPSTKQRLREASQTSQLAQDDSRAFWCVAVVLRNTLEKMFGLLYLHIPYLLLHLLRATISVVTG